MLEKKKNKSQVLVNRERGRNGKERMQMFVPVWVWGSFS